MILSNIFNVIQGHQITDYEIYMSEGTVPIYTGDNEIKGYWNKSIINRDKLPCLTYPSKAFSGNIYLQNDLFDANNTALLIPKKKWRDSINLEWFRYSLPRLFFGAMTSKEGVSYLNKDIVEKIDVEIPDPKIQQLEISYYKNLEHLKKKTKAIARQYEEILAKDLILDDLAGSEVKLGEIMSYVSRNDALSEEGIYKYYPLDKSGGIIKVLSGGTDNIEYGEISKKSPKIHFIEGRPVLHLVTRGKAGLLSYLPPDIYATNTNAFLLYLNNHNFSELGITNVDDEIYYLKFLKLYLEPKFLQMSSFADVSVFPLTDVMREMKIPKFILSKDMRRVVDRYETVMKDRQKLNNIILGIEKSLSKDLILN